jgi:hypothetical protein
MNDPQMYAVFREVLNLTNVVIIPLLVAVFRQLRNAGLTQMKVAAMCADMIDVKAEVRKFREIRRLFELQLKQGEKEMKDHENLIRECTRVIHEIGTKVAVLEAKQ